MGMITKEDKVLDLLYKYFPENAVPAIMGNISVETGGTFDYKQKQKGGSGIGLFQFDAQKKAYQQWLKTNKEKDSAENQVKFVHSLIYSPNPPYDIGAGHRRQLQGMFGLDPLRVGTPELAEQFMRRYERPGIEHLNRRIQEGMKYDPLLPHDEF